jgi:NAD(P)-dependent dehydrogenase (short-subunit alcohol dehydrogenase family)
MSTGEKVNTLRVAVVTGAAQGIGRAAARVLAQRGFALALNDLRPPVETSADVRDLTSSIELVGDIADEKCGGGLRRKSKIEVGPGGCPGQQRWD